MNSTAQSHHPLKLSANLGFLWADLELPDAIIKAHAAGFDAVECHWPYQYSTEAVAAALHETGLPMIGLNTARGDSNAGENGLAAVPGRESEARLHIDQAIDYAASLGCANVHVMAGFSDQDQSAADCFHEQLRYACQAAQPHGINILIEPLNHYDAPGYHLSTIDTALQVIHTVAADNLKIMFDCYHIQIMQGNLSRRLLSALPHIGHIQFAGVPDRGEPDRGEIHYGNLFSALHAMGWTGYLGAEYKPTTTTDASLDWMHRLLENSS